MGFFFTSDFSLWSSVFESLGLDESGKGGKNCFHESSRRSSHRSGLVLLIEQEDEAEMNSERISCSHLGSSQPRGSS